MNRYQKHNYIVNSIFMLMGLAGLYVSYMGDAPGESCLIIGSVGFIIVAVWASIEVYYHGSRNE